MVRVVTSLISLSCLVGKLEAFTMPQQQQSRTITKLNAALTLNPRDFEEDNAMMLMNKARECANSEECSIDDAKYYLNEVILNVESGCVAGTLAGKELCDVEFATDIVSSLRAKIEQGSVALSKSYTRDIVVQTMFQLMFIATVATIMTVALSGVNTAASPFTLQEWWWATRDGYLPRMLLESVKYGGLANVDGSLSVNMVTPFTLQEWWWAIKDGYLPTMMSSFAQHGGLAAVDGKSATATMPFTMQEWYWATKDGYLPTMASSFAQNGGLPAVTTEGSTTTSPVLPFTMQEWYWAMKDGYLSRMIIESMKYGGL